METKLTLKLKRSVIEKGKQYAREHNVSLSKMIERYLDMLTSSKFEPSEEEISPLVKSLSGVIALPSDFDFEKEYSEYLTKKYK